MPLTRSGVLVTAFSGVPTLDDIAHSLAQMPRFAGHTRRPWSVLDHSFYCAAMATEAVYPELQLAMFLHDAHESCTGDIPSDVKSESMRSIQKKMDERIMAEYFPGGYEAYQRLHTQVASYDRRALAAEALVLGPICETAGWREKVFGVAQNGDVALLKSLLEMVRPPAAEMAAAIGNLRDRIKG